MYKVEEERAPRDLRGVTLTPAERTAIDVLNRRGLSGQAIADLIGRKGETVRRYIKEARALLDANLPEYAALHLKAARVAADKGDGRPMEWAMERTAVVEPKAAQPTSPGFSVKIGVMLPGVPAGLAIQAGTVSQHPDSE